MEAWDENTPQLFDQRVAELMQLGTKRTLKCSQLCISKSGWQASHVYEVSSGTIIVFNWDDSALLCLSADCNLR